MIHFACETIKREDLIRCAFSLKSSEYRILDHLLDSDPKGVKEIAEDLDLQRSTVQKSLKTLIDEDLVSRRQFNLSSGGYKYVYRTPSKKEIKERVFHLIEDWISSAKESIRDW